MKKIILTIAIGIFTIGCFAQVNSSSTYVNGYYKSNGTYVNGYYRTTPDNTNNNNYSTKPNVNPWTGEKGTVKPDNNYDYSYPNSSTQPTKTTIYEGNPNYNIYETQIAYPTYPSYPTSPDNSNEEQEEE